MGKSSKKIISLFLAFLMLFAVVPFSFLGAFATEIGSYIEVGTETTPTTHNYEFVVTQPTCTEQGYTTHTCTGCGDSYVDSYVSALGHKAFGVATCTQDVVCSACGEVVVSATGHSYNSVITSPTCTEQGYTTHTCSFCGDMQRDTYISQQGHSYTYVITKPTCTEQGYTTRVCSVCGNVAVDSYVEPLGHSYMSVITKPTCETQGYTSHICTICGDVVVDTYVAANGHSYASVVTRPTCETQGYITHICSACGDSSVDSYVSALGHNYTTVVTSPTCTDKGYTTHTCTSCGDRHHQYIDTMVDEEGHSYTSVVTAPTCETQGYTTFICDSCGESYIDSYVEAKGHTAGEWTVVTDAKVGEEGMEERRCTDCGKQLETRAIGKRIGCILGDINQDGEINKKDYALLKRFCFDTTQFDEVQNLAANVNLDIEIDKKDYTMLKRYCFGTLE